ncbi:MAG: DnaB-like helicase C-terminal domain-containing protein, partial [Oscillospiraceae bacterium]
MADRRDFPFEQNVESLPYSIEAEQAVIGAIIADSRVIDDVAGILVPEYFYNGQNLQIFKEILLLSALGKPIDFVTVLNAVITSSIFEKEEDAKVYLYSITQSVPTISNVATYAKIVYDKYLLRSVIRICREVTDNAVTAGENAAQILDYAEQKLYEIRAGRDNSEMWRIDSVLFDVIDRLNKMSGPDAYKYRGIPTGFGYLDKVLTGLNKSDLIILAARPGVGKTSLALNIATNIARKTDYAVAMFSLEMSKQQLAQRIISNVSGVSSYAFRTGEVSSEEWVTIAEGMSILTGTGIYLDDTSGISVSEIKSKARRLKNLGL